jgi:hypothetical protein
VRRLLLAVLALAAPVAAAAQSSQFGVRGLGLPGRPLSTRDFSLGGAFSMFDGESGENPAALGQVTGFSAAFASAQDYRHVENPAGSRSLRETRFPFLTIAGPIKKYPLVLGVSFASYTSRDFTLATADSLTVRELPVTVNDTFSSRGGLSDLRFAAAYRIQKAWALGASLHVITGSTRLRFRRTFSDTIAYQRVTQTSELSYAGIGVDLGVVRNFGTGFSLAASVRSDGHANVDRDSMRVATTDLPYTFGFGMRWKAGSKLELASQVQATTWSSANSDIIAQGGIGAENTFEVSLGGEYISNPRRPTRRPFRFGVRYGTLPFPLVAGDQPSEFGVSAGTGVRFAQDRAGVDIGLERVWRSSPGFKERSFLINLGVTVRP